MQMLMVRLRCGLQVPVQSQSTPSKRSAPQSAKTAKLRRVCLDLDHGDATRKVATDEGDVTASAASGASLKMVSDTRPRYFLDMLWDMIDGILKSVPRGARQKTEIELVVRTCSLVGFPRAHLLSFVCISVRSKVVCTTIARYPANIEAWSSLCEGRSASRR